MSHVQYPQDFAFRRRPWLAARVNTFRAANHVAELGIILSALNGTPRQRATRILPRDSQPDYRM